MLIWLSLATSKYYDWRQRRDQGNNHNGAMPKSHWLLPSEVAAIIQYRKDHMDEGYRRLTYMMLDENVVAASPSTVYRVLKKEGLLGTRWRHQKAKGSGFVQPTAPHQHWHLDISYINLRGTFVYLADLIDGYSRYIVHHEVKASMEALDIEVMLERAREKFPGVNPVLITDNGPQFIAKEFKAYLRWSGITHRRTRFFYPESNGKIERFHQTCKNESIRRNSFLSLEDLRDKLRKYIDYYNHERLHSAIAYITPRDMMEGKQLEIIKERKEKIVQAQEYRKIRRMEQLILSSSTKENTRSEEQNQGREQRVEDCLDFVRNGA